jgi:hypothetical protein
VSAKCTRASVTEQCASELYTALIIKQPVNMSIYWWNALYYGSLISSRAIEKLVAHPLVTANKEMLKKVTFKVNKKQWIFHAPGMLTQVGWIEPLIEDHEIASGVIQWEERLQTIVNTWPTDGQSEDMQHFRTLADAIRTNPDNLFGYYFIQTIGTTFGDPDLRRVEHNFPIVNAPRRRD